MQVSASAYPWDVARLGVEQVLDDLVRHGISTIDLASTYHPIDALSPRDGALFTSARGAVHFPARPERYGRIKPSTSAPEICAAWPAVVAQARSAGVDVTAWTITLFQPWIIDANPDCARVLPSGDAVGSGVCPANDDVREYLGALCADVVDQFDVHMVRLESIMPLGYSVDWLRPRVLVDVPPLSRELLTLCFCATCVRRGTDDGMDVGRLRRLVREAIVTELNHDPGTIGGEIRADAELQAFLAQHEQASLELAQAVAARLEGSSAQLASTIRTPFPSLRGDAGDLLTEQLAEVVHQLAVSSAGGEGNRRVAAIAERAPHPVTLGMLIPRGLQLPLAAPPKSSDDDPLPRQLQEAVAIGVTEVCLYNYGLLRDEDVRQFMEAVRAASTVQEGEV